MNDRSVITPQQLDMIIASGITASLPVLIFGLYHFYTDGSGSEHYFLTYIPVIGTILSAFGVFMYSAGKLSPIIGFLTYGFGLYVFIYLGLGTGIDIFTDFSIGNLLSAPIWCFLGWRIVNSIYTLTELDLYKRN